MCSAARVTAGWILIIPDDSELARVLVALLLCVVFLALHHIFKPLRRTEDAAIMLVIELSLAVVYICVLTIKTCQESAAVCMMYGMGRTATGKTDRSPQRLLILISNTPSPRH